MKYNFKAKNYDAICVGAGYAGAVFARRAAEYGKRILVLEKRNHIAGNAYDLPDEKGVLIHLYGPHIFHTNRRDVFEFLSRFTEWNGYQHTVVASTSYGEFPVPFNLNSIELVYGDESQKYIDALISTFGENVKVTITELKKANNPLLIELADFVYENVFLHYTEKQWGLTPEEIDPNTIARVPVFCGRDNRYFTDVYQGLPTKGYTAMFERMLDHLNIETACGVDAKEVLEFTKEGKINLCGDEFEGKVVYSGALDELFDHKLGRLPYRTLDFEFEDIDAECFQSHGTVNYTVSEDFTRITEFKYMTKQKIDGVTAIVREYSRQAEPGDTPYYAIICPENNSLYAKYAELASSYDGFIPLGRLAEYKYYNMDAITARALETADKTYGD